MAFYGFPLVSPDFLCFPLVSKGETKEQKIQEKDEAIRP